MRDALRCLYLCQAFRWALLALWPSVTLAAGESLGTTLGAVTVADWAWMLLLSTVSGFVALLHRVRRSFEAQAIAAAAGEPVDLSAKLLIDWRLFAVVHMAGALFAGLLAFLISEAGDINNYLEAAGIALASWSGAKLADRWADAFNDRVVGVINSSPGKGTQP